MSLIETRAGQVLQTNLSNPDALFEVVDGRVVELPEVGYYAASIAAAIYLVMGKHLAEQPQGRASIEAMVILDPARNLLRRPDVSFLSFDRWPADREIPEEDDIAAVPDLAVEVISPGDLHKDFMRKLQDYLEFGVRQVWIVEPSQRKVWVYTSPTQVRILATGDTLEAADILPGFSTPIAPLFKRTVG